MSIDLHTVSLVAGTTPLRSNALFVGAMTVSNAVGSAAGASVTVSVAAPAGKAFPGSAYKVVATPNQDAVAFVTGKSASGFTLTLNPRLAANTLAAGTVDLMIIA